MMTANSPNRGNQNEMSVNQRRLIAPRSRSNSNVSSRTVSQTPLGPSPRRPFSPHHNIQRSGSMHLNSPSLTSSKNGLVGGIITQSPLDRYITSHDENMNKITLSTAPFIPNLSEMSHNPTVEAALDAERSRIKEREKKENVMDSNQLRATLKRERARSLRLTSDLATFKSLSVKSQAEAEAHEEGLINGLLRRLECLQKEKERIIVELEQEEEMLTNTLQKKLNEVRREKALLQKQIEKEHSSNADLKTHLNTISTVAGNLEHLSPIFPKSSGN